MIWPARNPSVQCKISTGFTWLSFRWAQRPPFGNMGCLNTPGPCHIGAFACEFTIGFHGSRMLTLKHYSPLKGQHVALSRTWSYEMNSMCRYLVMCTLSIVSARPHSIRASRIHWRGQESFQKHQMIRGIIFRWTKSITRIID
jgi:hypothetical protein